MVPYMSLNQALVTNIKLNRLLTCILLHVTFKIYKYDTASRWKERLLSFQTDSRKFLPKEKRLKLFSINIFNI